MRDRSQSPAFPPGRSQPAFRVSATREPWTEQASSFIGFFIYLLLLKTFFLPLFIIPTGSMAETLAGAHTLHACPNCAWEYAVNQPPIAPREATQNAGAAMRSAPPPQVVCPNCRWREFAAPPEVLSSVGVAPEEALASRLVPAAGDRIFVHGWDYGPPLAGWLTTGPQPWDVVVFKVPSDGQTNYIKRLIGLPGETIELVDGDVFVNEQIRRKTDDAQRSLWFPVHNQDYPPRRAARRDPYHPRWRPLDAAAWSGLDSRVIRFDGAAGASGAIEFVTTQGAESPRCVITDFYGYNWTYQPGNVVSDVRLAMELTLHSGDGGVELRASKYDQMFIARLEANGDLSLSRADFAAGAAGERVEMGRTRVDVAPALRLALEIADYRASLFVNDQCVLATNDSQFGVTLAEARRRAAQPQSPAIQIAADRVRAELRHVTVERDAYYIGAPYGGDGRPANGGLGHPITLGPTSYFCCGDNSPSSLDGRYWYEDMVGPHLKRKGREPYTPGTVPADQMIGRAFFVYWPGFLPLSPRGPSFLPDLGRVRWIR